MQGSKKWAPPGGVLAELLASAESRVRGLQATRAEIEAAADAAPRPPSFIGALKGDLVAVIHSDDAINESIRAPVLGSDGQQHPGFNRQQDGPNDGQARWNLISRNGQDVVSGIYLFTVDSPLGRSTGRFVVIR